HTRPASSLLFPYTTLFRSRRMTTALLLRQNVDLRLELRVRRDRARLRQHHPALDLILAHTPQQKPHVVARKTLVQHLAEHLHARDRKSTRLNSSHVKISYA